MQDTSDSSIWRSLAVAFGDGLAFGVGMKLSQHNAKTQSPQAQSDVRQLAMRMGQLEESLRRISAAPAAAALDQKVLEAIVNAVEARLQEYSTQAERRLADMEARLAVELKSLDQQDQSVARRLSQELAVLQGQLSLLNRGLGETIARTVAEQLSARTGVLEGIEERIEQRVEARVAGQVQARTAVLDGLEQRIGEQVHSRTGVLDGIEERIEHRVESRIAGQVKELTAVLGGIEERIEQRVEPRIAEQVESRTAVISGLEGRLESRVAEQVQARTAALDGLEERIAQQVHSRTVPIETIEERIGEQVQARVAAEQAGLEERIAAGVRTAISSAVEARMEPAQKSLRDLLAGIAQLCGEAVGRLDPPAAPETPPAPAEENDVPGFAQSQKSNKLWRVPIVSSMVVAIGGVILMQLR